MVVPHKGDYSSVPLSAEGRKVADSLGSGADGRRRVQAVRRGGAHARARSAADRWDNDTTLKIDTDAGSRHGFCISASDQPPADRTWQGHSVAEWERIISPAGRV